MYKSSSILALLLLAAMLAGCSGKPADTLTANKGGMPGGTQPEGDEESAIAALTKLHGRITRDYTATHKPAVKVEISGSGLVTDKDLQYLRPMKRLQELDLEGNPITDAGLVELGAHKGLKVLLLGHTKITDAGLKNLASLQQLQVLGLGVTGITDAGLKDVAALKQLKGLALYNTKITNAGLKELAGLKLLESIGIGDTKVTEKGIKELKQALPQCNVIGMPAPGN